MDPARAALADLVTAMGVEGDGLQKGPGVRCPHLAGAPGQSCSIYATRPAPRHEFLCMWRASETLLPANLQPSRVGFVVALSTDFRTFPLVITIHPDPAHPDSWKAPRHRAAFKGLAAKFNAIVVVGQAHLASHLFTPKGNEFTKARCPELFAEEGKRVGLPETEFLAARPAPEAVALAMWGR